MADATRDLKHPTPTQVSTVAVSNQPEPNRNPTPEFNPDPETAEIDSKMPMLQAGDILADRYEIVEVLGTGGMGAVYEAIHTFTRRPVAVKVMRPHLQYDEVYTTRFLREAQAISAVHHPSFAQVLDAGRGAQGELFIAFELLRGQSFGQLLREQAVTAEIVTEMAIAVCEGLQLAHERGLVHRDIKPENIFVLTDDRGKRSYKLLDFGIAKTPSDRETSTLTQTGMVLGTPRYMSPEQAQGEAVDHRTDIWSLAAVMYHALSGEPAYDASNSRKLMVAIATKPAKPIQSICPDVPDLLAEVVDKGLQHEAADRFNSAREFKLALNRYMYPHQQHVEFTRPLPAASAQNTPKAIPSRRSRKFIWMALSAGIVFALAFAGLIQSYFRKTSKTVAAKTVQRALSDQDTPPPPGQRHTLQPRTEADAPKERPITRSPKTKKIAPKPEADDPSRLPLIKDYR